MYAKFLGIDGTPWYYGKPAAYFYFFSNAGDNIKSREAPLTPDSFTTCNYIPNKLVLYVENELRISSVICNLILLCEPKVNQKKMMKN